MLDLKAVAGNKVTLWTIIVVLLGGGSYVTINENPVYDVLDKRYWKISSQYITQEFAIEDELLEIQHRIDNGAATEEDIIRKAVLEDRLRRLQSFK